MKKTLVFLKEKDASRTAWHFPTYDVCIIKEVTGA